MIRKIGLASLFVAAAMVGCGGNGGTDAGPTTAPDGGGVDTGPVAIDMGGEAPCTSGTCTPLRFIVNTAAIPAVAAGAGPDDPGTVAGFNIDGNTVDECMLGPAQAELIGTAPDNIMGVDASLNGMLAGLVGGALQDPINQGDVIILVELTDVDNRMNDGNVTITLYLGRLKPGVTAPMVTAGRITPGQAFDVDAVSIMNGQPLIRLPNARIVAGRVRSPNSGVTFPLSLSLAGFNLTLSVRKVQVGFTLSADGMSMTDGLLGGGIAPSDINNVLCCGGSACTMMGGMMDKCCSTAERAMNLAICANDVQGLPLPASSIAGLIQGAADLNPDSAGVCTEASLSLSLAGVSATFDPTMPVMAPIPTDAGPRDSGPAAADAGPRDAGGGNG